MYSPTEKDPRKVGEIFSTVAPVYDFLNGLLSLNRDSVWRKKFVDGIDLPDNGLAIDICTGTGDVSFGILKSRPEFTGRIIALDFSAIMIDRARSKLAKLGPPYPKKVEFMIGDALDLQYRDDKFDAAMVAFGVRNFTDTITGLEEMLRILKPGGQANILEFFPDKSTPGIIRWYLDNCMPFIGNNISHSKAYTYLRDTSVTFYDTKEFDELLRNIGFRDISWERMTFGIAHIVRARKGNEET